MGVNYNTSVPTDSLVFYVDAANPKSYPGSGSTWFDLIGGQNVTLQNSPIFSNNSIQFRENIAGSPRIGTATVDFGILRQSGQAASWTLETCFKYLAQTSGNGNFSVNENVILGRAGCHGGIYTWATNTIQAAIKTASCWTGAVTPSFGTLVVDSSYHAVMTYNNGVVRTYLNGQFVSTATLDYATFGTTAYGTTLFLGGINQYTSNVDMYFAKAYNKELSQAEVTRIFNAVRGRYGI